MIMHGVLVDKLPRKKSRNPRQTDGRTVTYYYKLADLQTNFQRNKRSGAKQLITLLVARLKVTIDEATICAMTWFPDTEVRLFARGESRVLKAPQK